MNLNRLHSFLSLQLEILSNWVCLRKQASKQSSIDDNNDTNVFIKF